MKKDFIMLTDSPKPEQIELIQLPLAELNKFLKEIRYEGDLFPEQPLSDYSTEQVQEFQDESQRALEEMERAFQRDINLRRRYLAALAGLVSIPYYLIDRGR